MSNENETRRVARQEVAAALRTLATDCGQSAAKDWNYGTGNTVADAVQNALISVAACAETTAALIEPRDDERATEDVAALEIAQPGPRSVGATTSSAAHGEAGTPLPPQPAIPPPSEANIERMRKTAHGVLLDVDASTAADNVEVVAEALARVYEGGRRECTQHQPDALPPLVGPPWSQEWVDKAVEVATCLVGAHAASGSTTLVLQAMLFAARDERAGREQEARNAAVSHQAYREQCAARERERADLASMEREARTFSAANAKHFERAEKAEADVRVLDGLLTDAARARDIAQPGARFEDRGETVYDSETGLEWEKATRGPMPWQEALDSCAALRVAGHDDWRLPAVKELLSIVGYGRSNPACDPVFAARSNAHWSSTTVEASPGYAWVVNFTNGYTDYYGYKTNGFYVRAVRAGSLKIRRFDDSTLSSLGAATSSAAHGEAARAALGK